jgi:hypothetical protein
VCVSIYVCRHLACVAHAAALAHTCALSFTQSIDTNKSNPTQAQDAEFDALTQAVAKTMSTIGHHLSGCLIARKRFEAMLS